MYLYVGNIQQIRAAGRPHGGTTSRGGPASQRASKVVVAKVTLPAQSVLTPDNVELRDVATDAVQPNAATVTQRRQQQDPERPGRAGEQILTHRLGDPNTPT